MTDDKVKETVERVARAICVKMGQEPDDSAPTGMICGPNNEPLPWWCFYEEQAEAAVLVLQAERDKLSAEVARLRFENAALDQNLNDHATELKAAEAKLTTLVEAARSVDGLSLVILSAVHRDQPRYSEAAGAAIVALRAAVSRHEAR